MANLNKAIQDKIAESQDPNSAGSIHFHWDSNNKTWCLSGETKSGLYWESDDIEAKSKSAAQEEAIEHLSYN